VSSSHPYKLVRLQLKDELHVQVGCSVRESRQRRAGNGVHRSGSMQRLGREESMQPHAWIRNGSGKECVQCREVSRMKESQPKALAIFRSDLGLFIFLTGIMARQARD